MSKTQVKTDESGIDRRTFLRASAGAIGAGAVAGGSMHSDRLSPVGDAEAVPLPAIGAVAGATAGLAIYEMVHDDSDPDLEHNIEDDIYNSALTLAQGQQGVSKELENDYPSNVQNSPYGRSAWHNVRTATVRELSGGNTVGETISAAQEALDKQTTRALINVMERHNAIIHALNEEFVVQYNELDTLSDPLQMGVDRVHLSDEEESTGGWEPEDITDAKGQEAPESFQFDDDTYGVGVWEDFPLPYDPTELDDRDEPLDVYYTMERHNTSSGTTIAVKGAPIVIHEYQDYMDFIGEDRQEYGPDIGGGYMNTIQVTSPDDGDTTTIYDSGLNSHVGRSIVQAYEEIRSDIPTYVETINDQLQQGVIEPADILGPGDIVKAFGTADEAGALGAQLLATGAEMPESVAYEAQVSHPDLEADELWGNLYPRFSSDDPPSIKPGMTLEPEDYDMAYFGFNSQIDGEWMVEVLSGDEPLEIHDAHGFEDELEIGDGGDFTLPSQEAGEDGKVVLYEGEDPPDPIAFPADHEGWQVRVLGNVNDDTIPVEDVQGDGDTYYVMTSLAEDETVEQIRIIPSVNYEQTFSYVADPTDVDAEETIARIERTQEIYKELEEALDSGIVGGGGGGGFGGFFDGFGSSIGQNMQAVVLAFVGFAALLILSIVNAVGFENRDLD